MSDSRQEKKLVAKISEAMLLKLEANRDRDDWTNCGTDYLLAKAKMKLKMLEKACKRGEKVMALAFAADVANFVAMAADVTEELDSDD